MSVLRAGSTGTVPGLLAGEPAHRRSGRSVRPSLFSRVLVPAWFAVWRVIEKSIYQGHHYTVLVPYGSRVRTPWFDPLDRSPFSVAHRAALAGGTLSVSADRCYLLHAFAQHAAQLQGDMAECGVYRGGSAQLLAETLRDTGKMLHLFDSFVGMPDSAEPGRDHHGPGDFDDTSFGQVQGRLADYEFMRFHPGWIPATFDELDPAARFAFVHIDLDIYSSTAAACEWFWPRLVSGAVMVFDDYGFFHLRHAARAAIDDFFADQIEKPIILPTGQAIAFKSNLQDEL